jgi:hypothetical protein
LKTILISSAVSIAIGFTFGWMIRSATSDLDTIEKQLIVSGNNRKPPAPPQPEGPLDVPPERISPRDIDNAISPDNNPSPDPAKPPESVEKAEQAKWNRLIEVLNLDATQAKILEAAITEAEPIPAEGQQLEAAYSAAGEKLQAKILSILNEDQNKAFKELQQRSLKNHLNAKSMQQYAQELGKLDLDASQMERAMGALLEREEEQAAGIPASTRLLLDGSVLPIGDRRISDDGLILLRKLATTNNGAATGIEEIAGVHRAEMQRRMSQFEGILTPAQLERYQAGIQGSSENLDLINPPN